MSETSTRPYLIRAIHEWCADNGFRPFIAVVVDERTVVPREFVQDGQIVLNVSPHATNRLRIGNEFIEFEARFGGVARQLSIPVENVSAIYAAENGEGMAFETKPAGEQGEAGSPVEHAPARHAPQAQVPHSPATLASVPTRPAEPSSASDGRDPESPGPGSPPRRPTLTRVK